MKRVVCIALLLGLLIGIAPISVNAALLEYDKWYKVSDVMFNDIVFDPQDPQLVYAGGKGGIYVSTDGGDNWTSLGLRDKTVTDIVVVPQNPQVIYAVGGGIYKSVDKGKTWTLILNVNSSCVDVNRSNPNVIYASGEKYSDYIYKSTDGGQTWEKKYVTSFVRSCPIASDPANPDIVYAGGGQLYRSTNGGEKWEKVDAGFNNYSAHVSSIVFNPENSQIIYCTKSELGTGNDGVYKSADGGENWVRVMFDEQVDEINDLAIDPNNPRTVYIALVPWKSMERSVRKSTDGGQTWTEINHGFKTRGAYLVRVNPRDPRILLATFQLPDYSTGTYKLIQATDTNNQPARNLKATPGNNQVTLQWEPPTDTSNVSGYYIYRTVNPGKYDEALTFVKGTSYVDKEVKNDQTYYYIVRVLHNDGSVAPASNEAVATPKAKIFSQTMILKIGSPFMTVNGVKKEIDPGRGTFPIIIQGRTLLPIRAVIEAMGGTVGWNANTRKVTITLKNTTITLTINSKQAMVNGKAKELDVRPQIINERTMVPLRFVAENLGAQVLWDDKSQTITIKYNK